MSDMSDQSVNDSSVSGVAMHDAAATAAGIPPTAPAPIDAPGDAFDPAQQSLAEALRVSFGILKFAMFGLLIAYCLSGTFSVGSNEVALRLRFGDYVGAPGQRVLERGTYLAAPFPIEQVIKVDTRPTTIDLNREFWYEITGGGDSKEGFRAGQARPLNPIKDGSLLTGDFNIAHARWSLTYRVANPEDYITNIGKPALGEEIVRCAIQQGIVQATAQLPAEDFLKGVVNRELAIGIAQRRLDEMKTGLTIDQLNLDQVTAPMAVVKSFDDVTTAEADRSQRIVAAQQDRTRILAEAAGEAAEKLVALVTSYEQAVEAGTAAEADAADAKIDEAFTALESEQAQIGGEAARAINAANTYRTQVVERVKSEREMFERLLPQYEQNPRIILSRLWEDAREKILTGDVETFYTVPGQLQLQLNRDPEIQKMKQREQLKALKTEQKEMQRARQLQTGK
jgi:regulator of protease activity HflC (stomatin/prohibitin superfamily)